MGVPLVVWVSAMIANAGMHFEVQMLVQIKKANLVYLIQFHHYWKKDSAHASAYLKAQ